VYLILIQTLFLTTFLKLPLPKVKILVIQTAFLGDVVLATSLIETIHRDLPNAEIHLIVKQGHESLFNNHPFIKKVWTWNKSKNKTRHLINLTFEIREEKFDQVINIHRYFSSGFITALSGAPIKIGFDKNPLAFLYTEKFPHQINSYDNDHEIDRNFQLVSHICDGKPALPKLYPSAADYQKIIAFKSQAYHTISPASVWFTKQLPLVKWNELIQNLPKENPIYILGASVDFALANELVIGNPTHNIVNLAGKLTFLQSAALMSGAVMNYTNDSAPLHLCSAMNAPVTAYFLSTIPQFGFGPLSNQSFCIEPVPDLSCRPCGLHGYKA
jgi:heptosyltransferase-2